MCTTQHRSWSGDARPLDEDEFVDCQEQEQAERLEAAEMLTRRRERAHRLRAAEAAGEGVLQRLGERTEKRKDAVRRAEEAREEVRRQEEVEERQALVAIKRQGSS